MPLDVAVDPCADVSAERVERLVRIELASSAEHDSAERSEQPTRAAVECTEEGVRLIVDDPLTAKHLERAVRETELPERGRDRLIALALVELVVASWSELHTNPDPVLPRDAPEASVQAARTVVQARAPAEERIASSVTVAIGAFALGGIYSGTGAAGSGRWSEGDFGLP